jgi:hypothetical protein
MKIGEDFIAATLLLLLFLSMLILALDWPEKARDFPLLIAVAGTGFSVWLVISMLIETRSESPQTQAKNKRLPAGTGGMVLWLALLFGVTIIFGFWVGSIFFMVFFLRLFGRENWKTSIGMTAILMAILFFTLSVALKIPIYGGVLKLTPF